LSLRDVGELDEVKNLREAEETHAVSSRHGRIDTLEGAEGAGRAKAKRLWTKLMRGGREPNGSAGWPRRGEGQESIGLGTG
jgi:hypothetical protein